MKELKVIRKISNTLYEVYSKVFNRVFCLLFGNPGPISLESIYCNPNYFMTPGGVIVRIDN
jgi:hypothetical protein